jgi:hypothetical protein
MKRVQRLGLLRLLWSAVERLVPGEKGKVACPACRSSSDSLRWVSSSVSPWQVKCSKCSWRGSAFAMVLKSVGEGGPAKKNFRRLSIEVALAAVDRMIRTKKFPLEAKDFEDLQINATTGRSINKSLCVALLWLKRNTKHSKPITKMSLRLNRFFPWRSRWYYRVSVMRLIVKSHRLQTESSRKKRFYSWLLQPEPRGYSESWDEWDSFESDNRVRKSWKHLYDRRNKQLIDLKHSKHLNSGFATMLVETNRVMRVFPWSGIKKKNRYKYIEAHLTLHAHLRAKHLRSRNVRALLVLAVVLGPAVERVFKRFSRSKAKPASNGLPRSQT